MSLVKFFLAGSNVRNKPSVSFDREKSHRIFVASMLAAHISLCVNSLKRKNKSLTLKYKASKSGIKVTAMKASSKIPVMSGRIRICGREYDQLLKNLHQRTRDQFPLRPLADTTMRITAAINTKNYDPCSIFELAWLRSINQYTTTCGICEDSEADKILACHHLLCNNCYTQCTNCPYCRAQIVGSNVAVAVPDVVVDIDQSSIHQLYMEVFLESLVEGISTVDEVLGVYRNIPQRYETLALRAILDYLEEHANTPAAYAVLNQLFDLAMREIYLRRGING